MTNDRFHNFVGEKISALGGRRVCNLVTMQRTVDLGLATVPDDASEEVQPFAMPNMMLQPHREMVERECWRAENSSMLE